MVRETGVQGSMGERETEESLHQLGERRWLPDGVL